MAAKLAWGIIGAGHIAEEFADGVNASQTGRLVAIASRERAKAERFGEKYGAAHRHGDYQALLDDPAVEAVYIATPHPMHAEWAIKAAEAGKHLLVEKPIGMNWAEATAMIDAARMHDVFLMEAFMYRCHPQTARVAKLIADGLIGRVGVIVANFGYRGGAEPSRRQLANELGGGGILDVGCYPVSMSRLIAGAAHAKPFEDPINVEGHAHLGETGVDEWAVATLEFSDGLLAQVGCAVRLGMESSVRIQGTDGSLLVRNPWLPSRFDRNPLIIEHHHDGKQDQIIIEAPHDLYSYEADEVGRHIADRQSPAMRWDDTLGNMRTLDRWRKAVGLEYNLEKRENATRTLTGRPLSIRPDHRMKYGRIAGLDKPISRLVLGCMSNNTMPDTNVMFDAFFSAAATPSTLPPATADPTESRNKTSAPGSAIAASATRSSSSKKEPTPPTTAATA
jgi:predicted dehydrogenase